MRSTHVFLNERILTYVQAGLRAHGRHRIDLAHVRDLVQRTAPNLPATEGRRFLSALCARLCEIGALRPIVVSGLDTTEVPPIPARFHNLLVAASERRSADAGLHPLLPTPPFSWRGTRELELLNQWVTDVALGVRAVPREPLRRRMLEIFGIEKARTKHASHLRLFPDWLGDRREILRLVEYPHPGTSWRSGYGSTIVMVENAETFGVLHEILDELRPSGVREMIFSSGNALAGPLDSDFQRIVYFGDWDADGLAILLRLREMEARVVPWIAAYRRLLEFKEVTGYRPRARALSEQRLAQLFPNDLLPTARDLCARPRLIAQEWLGLEEMRLLVPSLAA